MITQPLQWYVDKLKAREFYSLARYGDGELYCMWGREGSNCDGSDYTIELRQGLLASLRHRSESFVYGLQHVLPEDRERIEFETSPPRVSPAINWHDSEVFGDALVNGELFPLIEQLGKMETCVIGNESHRKVYSLLLNEQFIEVPPKNAHLHYQRVCDLIYKYAHRHPETVFLFSAGMASNVIIADLHNFLSRTWLLDVGHIWDVFVGNPPRSNTEHMTPEQINRNLKPIGH